MFGLIKKPKQLMEVGLIFYPLYKGQPENKMTHYNCTSVVEEGGNIRITRDDNAIYTYPLKDIMARSVRPQKERRDKFS